MTELQIRNLAVIFTLLTLISSWVGDDDVVYAFWDRDPTPNESIRRLRYVLVKFFASLYGGGYLALLLGRDVIKGMLMIDFPKVVFVVLIGICIGAFSLFIGVIQNQIRSLNGRPKRPPYDLALRRRNRAQWKKWWFGK
jgi:hypothetical protein